jgi:prevent-host-death family protein
VRELRNNLSRFLDRVREGEDIVVTDRGRAVARVVPMNGERTIDRLVARGLVTPARRPNERSAHRSTPSAPCRIS